MKRREKGKVLKECREREGCRDRERKGEKERRGKWRYVGLRGHGKIAEK